MLTLKQIDTDTGKQLVDKNAEESKKYYEHKFLQPQIMIFKI